MILRTLDGRLKISPDGSMRESSRYLLVGREGAARPDPAQAAWLEEFQNEIRRFPNGTHDDQVDALSQLLDYAFAPKDRLFIRSYRT